MPSATVGGVGWASGWPTRSPAVPAPRPERWCWGTFNAAVHPPAYDRVLATRFGVHAVDAVHEGDSGVMVALRGTDIVRVPLSAATQELKTVPIERYAEAEVFFG